MPASPKSRKAARPRLDPQAMAKHAAEAADFLKAVANDQRLAILCSLLDGPQSVSQINERVTLSQSALSQHLAVLRDQELVTTEKQAQTVYYAVTDDKVLHLLNLLHDCFCER
jgi:ArsR family transcriptional regulator, virulence genes transcriptional regulator